MQSTTTGEVVGGSSCSTTRQTATRIISMTQTRWALPAKKRSLIHPARSMPAHPAISKMPMVQPASCGLSGTAILPRKVGPQSSTAKRTT